MLCRVCRYLSPGFPSPTTIDNPLAPLGVSNLLATDLLCAGEVCIAKPCFTGRCYRLAAAIDWPLLSTGCCSHGCELDRVQLTVRQLEAAGTSGETTQGNY
jgi:hypothetical protein